MNIRLYVDEDAMDRDLIHALRARDVDVITALDVGLIERDDAVHLAFAATQGRVLYSFNIGDFSRLHRVYQAAGKSHAGMVFARQQRYAVGEQMRRLLKLIASKTAEEMKDRVEFLSGWA